MKSHLLAGALGAAMACLASCAVAAPLHKPAHASSMASSQRTVSKSVGKSGAKAVHRTGRKAAGKLAAVTLTLPGPAFPDYTSTAQVKADCDKGLAGAAAMVTTLESRDPADHWLRAYDELNAFMEDAGNPIDFVSNVHPDKAIRDEAQACGLRWSEFQSTLGQNETLYKAARQVKPADAIDAEFIRVTLEGFEDSGVGLPPDQRARAKAITDRIADLAQQFGRNVRDDHTLVPFTDAEMRGVPENVWKNAQRDADGHVLLGLSYPNYFPVMQTAVDPAARERMWRAMFNKGGDANLKLLGEITQLRREYARLFGFASYDDFTLRRKMAQSTEKVKAFLADVKTAVAGAEVHDLEELRQAKAQDLNVPADGLKFDRWDLSYYTEKVRNARYAVNEEAFRQYFPPQQSLQFALRVIEKMMGVKYTRVPAHLWAPDVEAFAVSDAATGKPLATLEVDLYPRDGKYNHAAVFSYRNGSTLLNRVPQAALVVNLDRNGLTLQELETLLHELGHSVHNNLSMTRYSSQAGTTVLRDFVEAPSQMLEDWVYDRDVLKTFAEVCPICKPVPDELITKAKAAKDYGKGVQFARQYLYASYDIALHDADAPEPMAQWALMEGATPLGYVPGSKFPASFGHLVGGYASGYYGYLWSLVVAMDLRTAFAANKLDPAVGRRYRNIVLANGGQVPPEQLVNEFLGRQTNSKAFFDYLKQ